MLVFFFDHILNTLHYTNNRTPITRTGPGAQLVARPNHRAAGAGRPFRSARLGQGHDPRHRVPGTWGERNRVTLSGTVALLY